MAPVSRAQATTSAARPADSTDPVGLPGEFSHTSRAPSTVSGSSVATGSHPARMAPTA